MHQTLLYLPGLSDQLLRIGLLHGGILSIVSDIRLLLLMRRQLWLLASFIFVN